MLSPVSFLRDLKWRRYRRRRCAFCSLTHCWFPLVWLLPTSLKPCSPELLLTMLVLVSLGRSPLSSVSTESVFECRVKSLIVLRSWSMTVTRDARVDVDAVTLKRFGDRDDNSWSIMLGFRECITLAVRVIVGRCSGLSSSLMCTTTLAAAFDSYQRQHKESDSTLRSTTRTLERPLAKHFPFRRFLTPHPKRRTPHLMKNFSSCNPLKTDPLPKQNVEFRHAFGCFICMPIF